ncbi:MAG: PAS domain S-box protein, partial [Syntrophorhabdaceae bacterium]
LTDNDSGSAQQRAIGLVFLVLILTTVPLTVLLAHTKKNITTSLINLRKGAEVIGSGDLGHRLAMPAKDELGELARSFDNMTEELQVVTVSKERLKQEIQERQRAEDELRENREQLRVTLASIGDAVIATDGSGRITFMNVVSEALTGWTIAEATQKPITEVFHIINEQTRLEVENPIYKVLREGVIVALANHTILIRKDGTEIPIDDSAAPIRDADGKIMGVVVVFRDITPRRQAEKELHKSRIDMDRAQQVGQIGSWRLDIRRNVLEWSDENYRIFGVTKGTPMTYEAFLEIIHPDDRQYVDMQWNAGLSGEPYDIEHRIVVNGQVKWVREKAYLEFDNSGALISGFGITQDITERKQLEEELRRSRDDLGLRVRERTAELDQAYRKLVEETEEKQRLETQLRQSQKMEAIGTLAGGIAHDFNNILAAIVGFTEMAIDDTADRPPVENNLKNVLRSAMRARDLVKQILAFSRKTNYERTPVSFSSLINETAQFLRASIPANIDIKLSIAAAFDTVLADPTELQQIVMNLATNAYLAMEEKGGILEINLTDFDILPESPVLEPDLMPGEYVQLMVKDTGAGMTPDVMRRAFEPFFTTRELGVGTGLGLAVVYGFVTDLLGTITVETVPGIGSIFRIFLPKVKTEVKEDQSGPLQIPTGNESILFVDDEDMLVVWAKATLERLEYRAVALTDPAEALKMFASDPSRFDLVITDQAMPAMSGMQLAGKLLAIRPDIPIILCTGHSATVSPEKAKKAGIKKFLMKPVGRADLAKAVRKVLDRKDSV